MSPEQRYQRHPDGLPGQHGNSTDQRGGCRPLVTWLGVRGQIRDATNANNPVNYLDTAAGISNATPNANPPLAPLPSFIKAQQSASYNDRLLVIDTSQLMPAVEQRVARRVLERLEDYRWFVGAYPWADCSDGSSDFAPDYKNRGRIPIITTLPANWNGPGPMVPTWFAANYWNWVIYYAPGKNISGGRWGKLYDLCEFGAYVNWRPDEKARDNYDGSFEGLPRPGHRGLPTNALKVTGRLISTTRKT